MGNNIDYYFKTHKRLTKEKDKLESEIKRVVGQLNNQGFLAKAPQALVDEEKAMLEIIRIIDKQVKDIKSPFVNIKTLSVKSSIY